MSFAHLASVPLLKGTQSKLNQNKESLGNALSLHDRSFQQSHFTLVIFTVLKSFICMFCVEIQIKLSPTQWYKQPKLQVSAPHTFLGSPFYIQRLCECL